MKVISKVRKIMIAISLFFIGVSSRVLGAGMEIIHAQPEYGVPMPPVSRNWQILRTFIIPLILLIGIIIYLKKSTQTRLKKVITVVLVIVVTVFIYAIVNYFIH
jgi:glucan phosphoethanolaminetransferase (alkaline phosphatase superfamily)